MKQQVPNEGLPTDRKTEQPIVIEVEFCCNCQFHQLVVRHQESKYHLHYQAIKKSLQQHKIIVKKKPVPENLYKKSPYCPPNVYYHIQTNQMVYFPQIGSFELYFQANKIFSKLQTLKWPTSQFIIQEIEKIISSQQKPNEQSIRLPHAQNNRYSLDRQKLFQKPRNNYLTRKSMTAHNQSIGEWTGRSNQTRFQRRNNEEEDERMPSQDLKKTKELTDEAVIQIYRKEQIKKDDKNANLPEIPIKTKAAQDRASVYLQPILPKTNINLENYTRQKFIIANKIHQQRKSYQLSKQQKKDAESKTVEKNNSLNTKAKFNYNFKELFKNKEIRSPQKLHKIKEATEENEIKDKHSKIITTKRQKQLISATNSQSIKPSSIQKTSKDPEKKQSLQRQEQKVNENIHLNNQFKQGSEKNPIEDKQKEQIIQEKSIHNQASLQPKTNEFKNQQQQEYNMNFQQQEHQAQQNKSHNIHASINANLQQQIIT